MKESYKASDIKVLDEISHIRLNAGMYIGDTTTPVHLVEEALDNALDECLAGFASIIAVTLDIENHIYSILDNGRGIPISNDVPKTISMKLFSGAKFQHSKTAYLICSGLHGVGLVAVNALSEFYLVEVYRNNKHAVFRFEETKFKEKKIEEYTSAVPFSTKIQFKPDKSIFETLVPDIDRVRRRLLIASIELPKSTFVLNVDDKREVFRVDKDKFFTQYCLSEGDKEVSKIINIEVKDGVEEFNVKFCYSLEGPVSQKISTSVNLLPVDGGGTHVNWFLDVVKDLLTSKAKRAGIKIQPYDCLCGLRAYLSLSLKAPEFSGQTKDKLINRKSYFDKLVKKLRTSLDFYFSHHQDQLDLLLGHFEQYRRKLDAKKIRATLDGKRAATKFTKLRDCTTNQGELFIVEGDSAGGSFIQCRDPRKHAIFPLKGKIPSVANVKDILKNKEINELIQSLGTGVGPHFDVSKLKYEKVICAADADADGYHIASLLTLVLAVLVPDVIKNGHYYIATTPLYAVTKGKSFVPLWTKEELAKARTKNEPISRFKGLGELSPHQLKVSVIDERTRRLVKVEFSKNMNKMLKLFSDVAEKRKLLENESINVEGE